MKALMKSFALLILVLAAASAGAQSFTGTVSGIVTDEQGGALPGATVTLTGKTGARTTVTDAKGEYRFTAVDPGTYDRQRRAHRLPADEARRTCRSRSARPPRDSSR